MTIKRFLRRAPGKVSAFDGLVGNAIEFLKKALADLKDDPKGSVINFYTAVELFLKARLLHEHWTLTVSKDANFERFVAGDFVSVTFDEALKRLKDIVRSQVPDVARHSFDAVRKHRNRIVHFYHDGLINPEQKSEIALEQLRAWYHLHRLLTKEWSNVFDSNVEAFQRMERLLVPHKEYAATKFIALKEEIDAAKAGGAKFCECEACGYEAARNESGIDWVRELGCLVCHTRTVELLVACPECAVQGKVSLDSEFECKKCEHTVAAENLYDLFNDGTFDQDEYLSGDAVTPANCDDCQSYQTVCQHKGKYLCVGCFALFDAIYSCEWCSSPRTSQDEDSYVTGCEYCDGYAGHHADD